MWERKGGGGWNQWYVMINIKCVTSISSSREEGERGRHWEGRV